MFTCLELKRILPLASFRKIENLLRLTDPNFVFNLIVFCNIFKFSNHTIFFVKRMVDIKTFFLRQTMLNFN